MPSIKSSLPWIVPFVLAGCASQPQAVHQSAKVPPLPALIGQKQPVDLTDRLTKLLMPNEQPSQPSRK